MRNIKQFNKKYNKRFIISFVLLLSIIFILFVGIIMSYSHKIEYRFQIESKSKLQYVSSQNVISVKKGILSKQDFLKALANNIREEKNFDVNFNLDKFKNYIDIYNFYGMGIVDKDGIFHSTLGNKLDFSQYDYFKNGMNGISEITQDYIYNNGKEMLSIYTVPIYNENKVEMILTASYISEKFSDLLNISSFDGNGESFIINSNGDLVTIPKKSNFKDSNIFKELDKFNNNSFETMKLDILNLKKNYIEYSYDGKDYLGFYEPIKIDDWYLFSYVPKSYIFKEVETLISDIRLMSGYIIIIFCIFSGALFIYYIKYQRKLSSIIFYDKLTNKENYEYLKMVLQNKNIEMEENKSLIVLDIDKFKFINIMYGSNIGDQMIVYLYNTFKEVLPNDEIYRNKADEFVGIINHKDKNEIINKLELLNNRIMEDIKNNVILNMNISIGICKFKGYTSLQRIYSKALIARNKVKGNTNNFYYFFEDETKERFIENGQIELEFITALKNNEFEVWYQPKYNMQSEKIIGAEALVRWRNKNGQLISPGKFIPIFEENGEIIRLDEEIIKLVCQDIREIKSLGYKVVPISINLSRLHICYPGIINKIIRLTKEYNIDSSEIIFEITESALFDDKYSLTNFINELHKLGFKVHMDDYGTGISCLSSLSSFAFDAIKLDKSFIDNIGDEKMNIVIKSTIKMANDLNMEIIAEGIENKEQVDFIFKNNCFIAQGFYFYRPVEKSIYFSLLKK